MHVHTYHVGGDAEHDAREEEGGVGAIAAAATAGQVLVVMRMGMWVGVDSFGKSNGAVSYRSEKGARSDRSMYGRTCCWVAAALPLPLMLLMVAGYCCWVLHRCRGCCWWSCVPKGRKPCARSKPGGVDFGLY